MKAFSLSFLILFCLSIVTSAQDQQENESEAQTTTTQQETTPPPVRKPQPVLADDADLNGHFKYLKDRSESYNDYKVIKGTRLNDFWVVVQDSVNALKSEISSSAAHIAEQDNTIAGLESTISEQSTKVAEADHAMTHITFLGIDFTKGTYITINVIVISALIVMLTLGFLQYKHSSTTAKSKIKEYDELQNQYEEFKKNALEKQIKLNRDLQTERNALEELKSKSTITKKITA